MQCPGEAKREILRILSIPERLYRKHFTRSWEDARPDAALESLHTFYVYFYCNAAAIGVLTPPLGWGRRGESQLCEAIERYIAAIKRYFEIFLS